MKVKSVVKIMNFHSLLRVNSAKKKAEKLDGYEKELSKMIDTILNNKNFILDKKSLVPPKDKNDLTILVIIVLIIGLNAFTNSFSYKSGVLHPLLLAIPFLL